MSSDIPGPELHHVPPRIRHISRPPPPMPPIPPVVMVEHRIPVLAETLDDSVVGITRNTHRVVNMHAAPPPAQTDLRTPQADACPVGGHHPNRLVRPPLNHRKPEYARIELLSRGQVVLLERDLDHPGHLDRAIPCHHPSSI